MKMRKKEEFQKKIQAHVEHFEQNGRFFQQHNYPHHKHVSVHEHVRHVAYTALKIAHSLKVKVDEDKLIRAALLHDYYLYDWHDDEAGLSIPASPVTTRIGILAFANGSRTRS